MYPTVEVYIIDPLWVISGLSLNTWNYFKIGMSNLGEWLRGWAVIHSKCGSTICSLRIIKRRGNIESFQGPPITSNIQVKQIKHLFKFAGLGLLGLTSISAVMTHLTFADAGGGKKQVSECDQSLRIIFGRRICEIWMIKRGTL